jgi:peptidoglycan/LPS O-acetylase OafA/YrhL
MNIQDFFSGYLLTVGFNSLCLTFRVIKMSQVGIRNDLSFLRALAVVSVLLFHFNISFISGGFAGVDVFFVISGYLMTRIIVGGLRDNNFSFIKFYFARARRIIPALLVLCLALLIVGWFILLPTEYRQLGKHTTSALTFFSNLIFAHEAGYFDAASHKKLLLHTWSLSVEWQFYIIYPIVLFALAKLFQERLLKVSIFSFLVLSFFCAIYMSTVLGKSVYFNLSSRAWEMMFGSIAFLFPIAMSKENKVLAFYLGLLLIICSFFILDENVSWPGYWTLLPVVGTFLVIMANYQESLIANSKVSTLIGESSYSIYLWHWPIVVILLRSFSELSFSVLLFGIALSFILGFLSFRFIELPAKKLKLSTLMDMFQLSSIVCFVLLAAVLVFIKNGFVSPARFENNVIVADQEYLNREPRKDECLTLNNSYSSHCIYGDPNAKVALILLGDSHGSAVVSAVTEAIKNQGSVLFIAKAGCLTLKFNHRIGKRDYTCREFTNNELLFIEKNYPSVPMLIVNRWAFYIHGKINGDQQPLVKFDDNSSASLGSKFEKSLEDTLCPISQNRKVSLLLPIPEFATELPKQVAKQLIVNDLSEVMLPVNVYKKRNAVVLNALKNVSSSCNINLIDTSKTLCDSEYCIGSSGNRPIYYDDNHLSEWGNKLLLPVLINVL